MTLAVLLITAWLDSSSPWSLMLRERGVTAIREDPESGNYAYVTVEGVERRLWIHGSVGRAIRDGYVPGRLTMRDNPLGNPRDATAMVALARSWGFSPEASAVFATIVVHEQPGRAPDYNSAGITYMRGHPAGLILNTRKMEIIRSFATAEEARGVIRGTFSRYARLIDDQYRINYGAGANRSLRWAAGLAMSMWRTGTYREAERIASSSEAQGVIVLARR